MDQNDMGHAGVAFTDGEGLEVGSFPEVMGIEDERLFPESEISKYCFEGIIGQSRAIRNVLEQVHRSSSSGIATSGADRKPTS